MERTGKVYLKRLVLRSSSALYATLWKHGPVFFCLFMAVWALCSRALILLTEFQYSRENWLHISGETQIPGIFQTFPATSALWNGQELGSYTVISSIPQGGVGVSAPSASALSQQLSGNKGILNLFKSCLPRCAVLSLSFAPLILPAWESLQRSPWC